MRVDFPEPVSLVMMRTSSFYGGMPVVGGELAALSQQLSVVLGERPRLSGQPIGAAVSSSIGCSFIFLQT